MMKNRVESALTYVADVLGSSNYSNSDVFIIIPHIRLVDEAAKQEYLESFHSICTFSLAKEPGTHKFCAFESRNKEGKPEIWALEHFDSEASLARHRTAAPVVAMLSWLMETKPNGPYPLPIPVPLQITIGSFVRPEVKEVPSPFIVVTQTKCVSNSHSYLKDSIQAFGTNAKSLPEVLLFMPAKTENGAWMVVTAYTTRLHFEESGFTKDKVANDQQGEIVEFWEESFLELKAGYLSRP